MIVSHLGNGVMLFEDVLGDEEFLRGEYVNTIFIEKSESGRGVSPDTLTNEGGYTVDASHISELPIRFHGLSNSSEFVKNITKSIDDGLYKCLVEY